MGVPLKYPCQWDFCIKNQTFWGTPIFRKPSYKRPCNIHQFRNPTATDVAFLVKVFPVSRPSTDKTLEPSQWSLRWWLPDSYPLELNQALHMASTTSGILLGSAWFQLVPIFSNALLPTLHLGPKKDLDQCCQSIIFNPYRQRKVQNHVHFPFSLSILVVWNFVKEFQTGSICLHTFLDLLGTSPTIPHGRSPATLENPWVKHPIFHHGSSQLDILPISKTWPNATVQTQRCEVKPETLK